MLFFKLMSWFLVLFNGILFSSVTKESSISNWIYLGISLLIMIILSNIPLIPFVRSKKASSRTILSSNVQFLFFLLFICTTYVNWGYGRTVGILGYNRTLGIFSVFNVPRTLIFILLCIVYVFLVAAVYCKFTLICDKHFQQFKKVNIIKGILIAVTSITILIECIYYFTNERLYKLLSTMVIMYLLCILILKFHCLLQRKKGTS